MPALISRLRDWPSRWFGPAAPAYGSLGLGCKCCGKAPYYYYGYYTPPKPKEAPCCPCPGRAYPDSLTLALSSSCSCLNGLSIPLSRTAVSNGSTTCSTWGCSGSTIPGIARPAYPLTSCGSRYYADVELNAPCSSGTKFNLLFAIYYYNPAHGAFATQCQGTCITGTTHNSQGDIDVTAGGNSCSPLVLAKSYTVTSGNCGGSGCAAWVGEIFPCLTGFTATFTITE